MELLTNCIRNELKWHIERRDISLLKDFFTHVYKQENLEVLLYVKTSDSGNLFHCKNNSRSHSIMQMPTRAHGVLGSFCVAAWAVVEGKEQELLLL